MGKGNSGRWLELHRPFLASAITVVVLLVELAVGHGASKMSPNKIKSPWYVPSASHPLHHQQLLHPCPLRLAPRRSITAPTRTSTSDTTIAHHVLSAAIRHLHDHPHHRFVRFHARHCANLHFCCCAPRWSTIVPIRISASNASFAHLAHPAALRHLHTHPHHRPVRLHRCPSRARPQVQEEKAVVAALCRRCHVRQGLHRCKSHRNHDALRRLLAASAAVPLGCQLHVELRLLPAALVWTEPLGCTSLWDPHWVSCQQSTMAALLQCCSDGRWWLGVRGRYLQGSEVFGLFLDGYAHIGGLHARQECTRRFNVTKGTSNIKLIICTYLDRKYGSGNALRADLRLRSMLVLRFDVDESSTNILSPVKQKLHLRLKILNPRRHRPIRQPGGAPVVLSECDKGDHRCLWRGQLSLVARRPRWRYHPCLLHYKCRIKIMRPSSILKDKCFHLSHMFDSFVVAQKLQPLLGGNIPIFVLCFNV